MPAVFVYIDGFNLYYGALRGTAHKWLNPVEMAKRLLPAGHTVAKLKYFTARVSGAADTDAPRRQHKYLLALSTLPETEIHYGRFLAKTIWRPLANLPVAAAHINSPVPVTLPAGTHVVNGGSLSRPNSLVVGSYPARGAAHRKKRPARPLPDALVVEAHCMEEKGSDVNLAAHLLNDAWKGAFDAAMVVSNDTDLIEPIRMVTVELSKPVFVVCPGRWPMAPGLEKVASYKRQIHPPMLSASQFPSPIPGTTLSKPPGW